MRKYLKIITAALMATVTLANLSGICSATELPNADMIFTDELSDINISIGNTGASNSVTVGFSDVDTTTTEGLAIKDMQSRGYIQGFGDGTFRPGNTLTRAEFITIINKMYKYYVRANNIFKDVKQTDWYYEDVLVAIQAGYIKGMGDGTFCPNETISREQVCKILVSILHIDSKLFDVHIEDAVSEWAMPSVEMAISTGLFSLESGGTFRATEPITRGEVCVALQKCIVDETNVDVVSSDDTDLNEIIKRVVEKMETIVIPSCTMNDPKKMAVMITDSLKKYLEDPEYDYIEDSKDVYKLYSSFNARKADEIKGLIFNNMDPEEIMILNNYFYDSDIIGTLNKLNTSGK